MTMTPRVLRLALWCAEQELTARRAGKPPGVQPWNAELIRALQFQLAASRAGHECGCLRALSKDDRWISAREAAVELELSKRHVNRIADDLDGVWVDGRRMFRETAVVNYAEGRRSGRAAG